MQLCMSSQTHAQLSWGFSLLERGQNSEAALSQIVSTQCFVFRKERINIDQACTQAQKQCDSILQRGKETEAFWGKSSPPVCLTHKRFYYTWIYLDQSWKWLSSEYLATRQENTAVENLNVFSSSICFPCIPSIQITTSLFTWKWELETGKEKAQTVIDIFYWDLLYISHGEGGTINSKIFKEALGTLTDNG